MNAYAPVPREGVGVLERVQQPHAANEAQAARELRALAAACLRGAEAADRLDYHGSAAERAVLNAIYDLTECDAIYDMAADLAPCDDDREPLWMERL